MPSSRIVALHHQVYLTLRNELLRSHFATDAGGNVKPLPAESELAAQFGISRMTVRRALAALEQEGLILRRHGSGTYPVPVAAHLRETRDVASLYREVSDLTRGYQQEILSSGPIRTPSYVASMAPDFGPDCFHLHVLCRAEGVPVHLNSQYIPAALARGIRVGKREPASLLLRLSRRGIRCRQFEFNLSATVADLATASRLEVEVGMPLITTRRIATDRSGRTLEFFEALTRPDRYSYSFKFSGDATQPHTQG